MPDMFESIFICRSLLFSSTATTRASSVYINSKQAQTATDDLKGSFSGTYEVSTAIR